MLGRGRREFRAELDAHFGSEESDTPPPALFDAQRTLRLSVIVPVYNGSATLERALACIDVAVSAVLRSTGRIDVERIVVDDNSTDDSASIAEARGWKVVALSRNQGPGVARNCGVANSSGDLLVFVDADALIPEETLIRIADDYGDPKVGAITSLLDRAHQNPDFFSQFKNLHMHYSFCELPREVAFLYGTLHSVRRKHFVPYDPRLLLTCDTQAGRVLAQRGVSIILDRRLSIGHLKQHSFSSLLSNDFRVPIEWGACFLRSKGIMGLVRSRRYAHASMRQMLSLLLAAMVLVASIFGCFAVSLASLLIFYFLNARFISFLRGERGWWFATRSAAFIFLDSVVMGAGAALGIGASLFR